VGVKASERRKNGSQLPSAYVKIAIEAIKIVDLPMKNGGFP
jgi:hypothetical protein